MIHAELKFFFHLPPDIKLNTFTFIFFTLFGTHNQAYGSSVSLQLATHLMD